jgi:hypothetical protein
MELSNVARREKEDGKSAKTLFHLLDYKLFIAYLGATVIVFFPFGADLLFFMNLAALSDSSFSFSSSSSAPFKASRSSTVPVDRGEMWRSSGMTCD